MQTGALSHVHANPAGVRGANSTLASCVNVAGSLQKDVMANKPEQK